MCTRKHGDSGQTAASAATAASHTTTASAATGHNAVLVVQEKVRIECSLHLFLTLSPLSVYFYECLG
jgi:hypothetical protein